MHVYLMLVCRASCSVLGTDPGLQWDTRLGGRGMGLTKAQRRPTRGCISLTQKRHHEQGTRGPGACVGVMGTPRQKSSYPLPCGCPLGREAGSVWKLDQKLRGWQWVQELKEKSVVASGKQTRMEDAEAQQLLRWPLLSNDVRQAVHTHHTQTEVCLINSNVPQSLLGMES